MCTIINQQRNCTRNGLKNSVLRKNLKKKHNKNMIIR